jgi:hypothetical protein
VLLNVSGQFEMNDGESISLKYFSRDNLPKNLEKRAKALIETIGDYFWELDSSFSTSK